MSVHYSENACDLGLSNDPEGQRIILTMLTMDDPAQYHETDLSLSYNACWELIALLKRIMSGKATPTHNGDCEYYASDDLRYFSEGATE